MAPTWLRNRAEPEEAGPDLNLDFDRLVPDHHVFVCEEPGVRRHRQRQGADRDSAQDEGAEGQRFGATVHRYLENLHRLKGNCHHRVVADQPRIRYIVYHIICRCWYLVPHSMHAEPMVEHSQKVYRLPTRDPECKHRNGTMPPFYRLIRDISVHMTCRDVLHFPTGTLILNSSCLAGTQTSAFSTTMYILHSIIAYCFRGNARKWIN